MNVEGIDMNGGKGIQGIAEREMNQLKLLLMLFEILTSRRPGIHDIRRRQLGYVGRHIRGLVIFGIDIHIHVGFIPAIGLHRCKRRRVGVKP